MHREAQTNVCWN